ncbi:MAG: hypothetical protein VYA84_08900 [Planctomycetota bacterium]|nr:hypothetical protein [Planctomycetota bacterium]
MRQTPQAGRSFGRSPNLAERLRTKTLTVKRATDCLFQVFGRFGSSVDGDSGDLRNAGTTGDDADSSLPDDEEGVLDPSDLCGTIGAQILSIVRPSLPLI